MGHLGLGCFQPGPQLVEGWRWVNELRVARLHIYVTKVNVITPSNSAPGVIAKHCDQEELGQLLAMTSLLIWS